MRLVITLLFSLPAFCMAGRLTQEEKVAIATNGTTGLDSDAFVDMVGFVRGTRPLLTEAEAEDVVKSGDYRTPTEAEIKAASNPQPELKDSTAEVPIPPANADPASTVGSRDETSWKKMSLSPSTEEVLANSRKATSQPLDAAFGKAVARDPQQENVAAPSPYKGFTIIATAEGHCAVPSGSIVHLPEKLKVYIVEKPQGKYISFKNFLQIAGTLIRVHRLQPTGKGDPIPLNQKVLSDLSRGDQITITEFEGTPFPFESE